MTAVHSATTLHCTELWTKVRDSDAGLLRLATLNVQCLGQKLGTIISLMKE